MCRFIIHVGLHKTGTSLLQKQVFPLLEGDIDYLGRPYRTSRHFLESVCWSRKGTVLVSSETYPGRLLDAYEPDRNYLEDQLQGLSRLARLAPDAAIIIGVRPHRAWIASIYKHYLKYGGTLPIEAFFGFDGTSLMKPEEFLFAPRLDLIRTRFSGGLMVYNSSDLADRPDTVIRTLEAFIGARYTGPSSFERENEGVGARQASALRILNKVPGLRFAARRWKRLDPFTMTKRFVDTGGQLEFGPEMADEIDAHYRDDWAALSEYLS